MGAMDRDAYLAAIERESDALLAAATDQLATSVPSCPGWSMERLTGHLGRVYRWTTGWVTTGESIHVERPPEGQAVLEWTASGREQLVGALEHADLTGTRVTWAGEQPGMFWPRRMALETAIHRWDAQSAVAEPAPIDAELAVIGIDEALDIIVPQRAGDGIETLDAADASFHLHATDVTGEWLVTVTAPPEHLHVERKHAKGDVAARGTASDLLLTLWNRVDLGRLEIFGDRSLLERWSAHIRV